MYFMYHVYVRICKKFTYICHACKMYFVIRCMFRVGVWKSFGWGFGRVSGVDLRRGPVVVERDGDSQWHSSTTTRGEHTSYQSRGDYNWTSLSSRFPGAADVGNVVSYVYFHVRFIHCDIYVQSITYLCISSMCWGLQWRALWLL